MYEALLKNTAEYQKIAESLRTPGPAALFGLPPAGRALLYAALQKDLGPGGVHRHPRGSRGHPLCGRPQGAGAGGGGLPAPGPDAAPRWRARAASTSTAACRCWAQLAGGRLQAVCVPAEALLQYTVPPGRIFEKHPHPQARHGLQPGDADGPAVCRRVRPAHSGGRPGPVQRPGRHRGHLRPRYAPARPCGVLGRRDRFPRLLRPAHPAPGRQPGEGLPLPCPGGAVRRHRRDGPGPARCPEKSPGQAAHCAGKGHGGRSGPAGFRPDARGHGQILRPAVRDARHPFRPPRPPHL